MLKISLCDDSEQDLQMLKKQIVRIAEQLKIKMDTEIHCFASGEALLDSHFIPDIAFMDIELKSIGGIKTGSILREKNPDMILIITTSFLEYLDEAMAEKVFRYILKPVEKERLFRVFQDALDQYLATNYKVCYEYKSNGGVLKAERIGYVESYGHQTLIHTTDGTVVSTESLGAWKQKLNRGAFIQTHRSYIVNMNYVIGYTHNEIELEIDGHRYKALMTYRKYYHFFKEALMRYLGGKRLQ